MYVQVFTCKTSAVGAMICSNNIDGMLRINVRRTFTNVLQCKFDCPYKFSPLQIDSSTCIDIVTMKAPKVQNASVECYHFTYTAYILQL